MDQKINFLDSIYQYWKPLIISIIIGIGVSLFHFTIIKNDILISREIYLGFINHEGLKKLNKYDYISMLHSAGYIATDKPFLSIKDINDNQFVINMPSNKKNFESDSEYLNKVSEFLFDNIKSDFENSILILKNLNEKYKIIINSKPLTDSQDTIPKSNNFYNIFNSQIYSTEVILKRSTSFQPYMYKIEVKPAYKKNQYIVIVFGYLITSLFLCFLYIRSTSKY